MTENWLEKSSRQFERGPAADLWRNTLAQIATVFGRLVYLSSLRNPNTGLYEHFGLAQIFGGDEAHRTLRHSHAQIFTQWLEMNVEHQKADLGEYLSALEERTEEVLGTWSKLAPYRNLMPTEARDVERDLYLADLEAVLVLLRHEYGVASPDPEA